MFVGSNYLNSWIFVFIWTKNQWLIPLKKLTQNVYQQIVVERL